MQLLRLAIPSPLRRYFDYLPPKDEAIPPQPEGCRVLVPFGRQKKVGFVVCITQDTAIETSKLRPAIEFIDTKPLLPKHLYDLGLWAANYYQHPIGDALFQMYPTLLRKGEQPKRPIEWFWRTTGQPFQIQKRAVKQTSLYNFIASYNPNSVSELDILNAEHAKATLKALADKGVIEKHTEQTATPSCNNKVEHQPPLTLNDEQAIAVDAI
ncbi:MAG: primosomal protein N', partial [Pontibacterium sp.]